MIRRRPPRPLVIAHRGASGERPENTLSAYQLAVAQRADMIEIDLHRTRDGQIAIAHDADLSGLGGQGKIGDQDFEALRALDAGGGERIPCLEEVLDGFAAVACFNLEIKCPESGRYAGLEAATLDALKCRGLLERTLLSSFSDDVLRELRCLCPEARLATLVSVHQPEHQSDCALAERAIESALEVGAEAVNPHLVRASEALVGRAHAAGLAVYVYTVDDETWMEKLLVRGVDGMFSNFPARLRRVTDAFCGPASA